MTAATVYCYTTCPGPNGCECFDGDGNEKLVPASKYGLTDAQRERDERDEARLFGYLRDSCSAGGPAWLMWNNKAKAARGS